MKITNHLSLPQPIVDAVASDDYDRGEADFTVSELLKPPQIRKLEHMHAADLEEDASERIYSLIGKSVHGILDAAEVDELAELRLMKSYTDMRDGHWEVSGKFDRYVLVDGVLQDYKIMSVWEVIYGLKPEKEAQLNIYADLIREHGGEVNTLQIVGILRDWSKGEVRRRGSDYPNRQVVTIDVPVWSQERIEQFVAHRIELHLTSNHCTAEDRWATPTKYALMKKGRQKAIKLFDLRIHAEAHMNENGFYTDPAYYIEERPGENKRCMDYCPVSAFCPQWNAMQEAAE